MKYKSIGVNAILNGFRGIMKIVFPLITFPYISRILGVENVGHYNFASSIVNYFGLIAALGITTYAVREGAQFRGDQDEINNFASQIFSISIYSAILSYSLLIVLVNCSKALAESRTLILLLSLRIAFEVIGIEWIYIIYEDFLYITVRSILMQISSIIMLFIFVRTKQDLYTYALITVMATGGSNLLNWIHSKKYGQIKIKYNVNIKEHIKPILVIFATTITISIYSTADTTILGVLKGNHSVGLYSVSSKIYDIVKAMLASVIIVSIPRIVELKGNNKLEELQDVATRIYKVLISLAIPSMTGIVLLRNDIILLISGKEYLDASFSLALLSIAIVFNVSSWFWGQCILIPFKQEKILFVTAVVTAVINILLNFLFIPLWGHNAAALTTVIAEFLVLVIERNAGKKFLQVFGISRTFLKIVLGSMAMGAILLVIKRLLYNIVLRILLSVVVGAFIYLLVELLLKNDEFLIGIRKIRGE